MPVIVPEADNQTFLNILLYLLGVIPVRRLNKLRKKPGFS
jgi:hypothetical protein